LADEHGKENLLIVFGINQIPTLRIMAQTFKRGDPSFSGALAGIELGILSYHIFEIKDLIPADVWEKEMAMHELELEGESQQAICKTMAEIRQG
jgi:hypothetical protein